MAPRLNMKRLKQYHNKLKFVVFGYVRSHEREFNISTVSLLISYLTLFYYHHGEYFIKSAKDVTISEDKSIITKTRDNQNWKNTNYCSSWIQSNIPQICEWSFKLYNVQKRIFFCFVSNDDESNMDCNNISNIPNYGFDNTSVSIAFQNTKGASLGHSVKTYGTNDTIKVILNTKDGTIRLKKNEESSNCLVFSDITIGNNIKYKMAIQLYHLHDKVALIDFTNCLLI